jgi:aarF domain-containing kinase
MDLSLPVELDFRMEAQNATVASDYFKKHSDAPLVIPEGKHNLPTYFVHKV